MSLIEKAAKRLEQLKNAGVDISGAVALEETRTTPEAPLAPAQAPVIAAVPAPQAQSQPPVPTPAVEAAVFRRNSHRHEETVPPPTPQRAAASPAPSRPTVPAPPAAGAPRRTAPHVEIDLIGLQEAGFLSPAAPNTQLAHELRIVKRPLLRNAQGKGAAKVKDANLIMVTSALPGEGKSFVSLNLALSIAMELDSTVLFIDADVIKPSLPRMLRIPKSIGLMDLLTDRNMQVADVLHKTNIDRFSYMQAGTGHPRAAELLASDAMADLVQELGKRYPDRIILFDSPPLLATTESRVLASHMGQIVMVVEEGRTRIASVKEAMATVESCPVVMSLLNKATTTTGTGYYGTYGSYGAYGSSAREANG
ncbi:MAG: XrtA-associated tyrosine autokinase [Burkholderiales bacterium]|nr:XrtA-associated tyrosine autokinase [Burkholderiales bacterium]